MPLPSSTDGPGESPPDWDAIARYLADESSAEEADHVRRWLGAHPGDAALVTALDGIVDRVSIAPTDEVEVEEALRRVTARRDEGDSPTLRFGPRPVGPVRRVAASAAWWRSPAVRAAAVLVVAVLGGVVWRIAGSARSGPVVPRTFATRVGVRDSLRLPDGSRVVLGPGSQLIIGARYGNPDREVDLRGEAFFDVRHDDAHAFTVRAGSAIIRDVGTTFTVRTDAGDRVRVAVSSGVVMLGASGANADRSVILHQGDVGTLVPGGATLALHGAATEADDAWTRGRLEFREAPLSEVRAALARWYGIELRIADSSLAGKHLTMSFDGDPPEHVLRVIALTLGATIERHGDTAVVRPTERGSR